MVPAAEDCSLPAGLLTYALTAAAALFLLPGRELATLFALLGSYPILRPRINAIALKSVRTAIKLAVIVVSATLLYALVAYLYAEALPSELAGDRGLVLAVFLTAGLIYFLLYDFVLDRCARLYRARLRGRLGF